MYARADQQKVVVKVTSTCSNRTPGGGSGRTNSPFRVMSCLAVLSPHG